MKKIFCTIFLVCFILTSSFCVSATAQGPLMEQGTINSGDGY